MKELVKIQQELKAPKLQFNNFGGYRYRSLEDILEALKPVLKKYNCSLVLTDEIETRENSYKLITKNNKSNSEYVVEASHFVYIKATATLINESGESISTTAYAREPISKKGMDEAQITGASSSYARKYALNGLFAIDDTKDNDIHNGGGYTVNPKTNESDTITEDQLSILRQEYKKSGIDTKAFENILRTNKVADVKDIKQKDFNKILTIVKNYKKGE